MEATLLTVLGLFATVTLWILTSIKSDIKKLEEKTDARFERMDARFEQLEGKVDARFEQLEEKIDARFEQLEEKIDARFEQLEEKIDARFDRLETRVSNLEKTVAIILEAQVNFDKRLDSFEKRMDIMISEIKQLNQNFIDHLRHDHGIQRGGDT